MGLFQTIDGGGCAFTAMQECLEARYPMDCRNAES